MDHSLPQDLMFTEEVRDDFIPKNHYTSPEIAELERTRLWPKVWQMACREEELPNIGSFVTYDIAGQSIIVVRTGTDKISAFHNVCPHRGNQLVSGCGLVKRFYCSFHGWKWDVEGRNIYIKDAEDWAGCDDMRPEDVNLSGVKTSLWGGFVFINMDPDSQSFEEFIAPVPQYLDCLEFDRMRLSWYKTMRVKGNWKTALESFMESYHVYTTHAQLTSVLDDISVSTVHGIHGKHGYPNARPLGAPSARTGKPIPADIRPGYVKVIVDLADQTSTGVPPNIAGAMSGRSAQAAKRVLTEVAADASPLDVMMAGLRFMQEAAEESGAGWPTVSSEQLSQLGVDWNVFPNMVLVFNLDTSLVFRARPDGDDPDSSIFDMWGIIRTAPDKVPAFEREVYEDWRANADLIPSLLVQDLHNIEKIQRGMHSIGFKGSRTNPVQETQISNHHKVLVDYLRKP